MKPAVFSGLFLAFGITLLSAQPAFIPLNVDHSQFRVSDREVFVETCLSFYQKSLVYSRAADSSFVGKFTARMEVLTGDSLIHSADRTFNNTLTDLQNVNPATELRHIFPVKLSPGDYTVRVSVDDLQSGARGQYESQVQVSAFGSDALDLSDIQLCAKIDRPRGESAFNKSGLLVVPNPSGVYSIGMPMIYFYVEAYNFQFSDDAPGTYTLETWLSDEAGEEVRRFPPKTQQKPGRTAVLVGGHNIITLASDNYYLNIAVTDDQSGSRVEKRKRLRLFKPSKRQLTQSQQAPAAQAADLLAGYYRSRSEEELDTEFSMASYIASNEEKSIFKTLNKEGKANFLVEFWQRRDPDRATPQNEYRQRYFEMVRIATISFETKFREGWKTDRGRVLLTYGQPNDIEKSPLQQETKPFETWYYDELEGGSIFIFADLRGFGEYELLHSTYSKELSQPDWERLIQQQTSDDPGDIFR